MPGPSQPSQQTPYNAGLESSNIAQSLEGSLPSYLQIGQNPLFNPNSSQSQGFINNYANQFYNEAVMPQVSQMQTGQLQQGMQNSSAGGAQLGQAQAQGAVQSQLQGINAYEALLGGMNTTAGNYFSGPGGMATTDLGASNQYQQQGYGTASQNYRAQLGLATAPISGLSGALTGGASGALGNAASAYGGAGKGNAGATGVSPFGLGETITG
jgi:hypothetical protein